jgi:cellobiose-specific phosphotransferase system component IIA
VRFVTAQETAHRVLYEDIDLTKMNNLAKVEEEQHKTDTYLMQSNKSTRKSVTIFIIHPRLLLETTMMKKSLTETVLIIYQLGTSMRKYFQNAAGFSNWYQYCRLFTRNFKRFISYLKYDN